ncbi:right-handed parallel beta-helix repeat-containing protein [Peribacillus loiseleuriae]|uniref:right-handed parallel beta-helix repeat-containing protein n=1 Tax=Peribacillus loiseleuriae TaxID=1679170 RepID=UPI003D08AEFB
MEHCGDEKKDTTIYVIGFNHKLEGLDIETKRFGIRLDNANGPTIQDSEIVGRKQGNGIDLWKFNQNTFENLKINNVTDGIYLEKSNENALHRNDIQRSRCGVHLMFSNENVLAENSSRANITGTMLMESKWTVVSNNKFASNNESVNAQGLLIYLSTGTEVTGNEFISNRIGIYGVVGTELALSMNCFSNESCSLKVLPLQLPLGVCK